MSFDKGDNKKFALGFSLNDADNFILQNVLILQDKIHWKSSLDNDLSVVESDDGTTTLSNVGNTFLNNEIRILQDARYQTSSYIGERKANHVEVSFYEGSTEVNFETIDTNHSVYIKIKENDDTYGKNVLTEDFSSFVETDFIVTPTVLSSKVYNSDTNFSKTDDIYITLESVDDLVLLTSDYEITIDSEKENYSTIVLLKNNETDSIYYDKIDTDRVRFVISDYGRFISFAQHNEESNSFHKTKSLIFSSNKLTDENQTVSIRLSSDIFNSTEKITVNF